MMGLLSLSGLFLWHLFLNFETTTCSSDLRLTQFYRWKNASLAPTRLGIPSLQASRLSCARNCLEIYENCTSFMFNSNTSLCTAGTYLNQNESPLTEDEGELYYMADTAFDCNATEGFTLRHYGNSTACAGIFNNPTLNYTEARKDCRHHGGFLASVKTLEKFQMLKPLAENLTSNVYVGCNDLDEEGKFIWDEDQTLLTQETINAIFKSGEPNNSGDEDCIILYRKESYLLNDRPCDRTIPYICELRIP